MGARSAIGNTVEENLAALRSGETGLGPIRYLDTVHRNAFPAGEVKHSNAELAALCGWQGTNSRTAMLGYLAAKEALEDAGIPLDDLRCGLINATSVAGMDLTEEFFPAFLNNHHSGRLRQVVQHECGAISRIMSGALGIHDFVTTISTACSSAANAIMLGARMIRAGRLDLVVAGGTDALSRFTLNGFNTLMILDHELCQPFDQQRRGLNLGEGAGYLVLISEALKTKLGRSPEVTVSGYANANDAHHQTASSPEGAGSFIAMKAALEMSGLSVSDIDYINLHGTGTQNNDASESTAIRRIFGDALPRMSSTKGFTGHTLAACGGIEAVYAISGILGQCLFPGLRIVDPVIPEAGVMVNQYETGQSVQHVLSNSFGFGGNCSTLIFSRS
ncbi:putative 3-oxoacyl-[acyl-carrier-protein] synthase [Flavihumibacter petaseus NBRC 106054]|uniref:Putative 3-oxoacyl-[acyl-carrier-protein] synthase n=2 Tax=Flavihumibacter TaxID=1004301 RepID=A0A0E9MWX1_9BACT|nr:putative 3-oxoacyl-[acyl-carrier-protein] synthase [Flavihumibacter petaseus NBRC 106054]